MAFFLYKLFTLIGAPSILQTDNGAEVKGHAGLCFLPYPKPYPNQ